MLFTKKYWYLSNMANVSLCDNGVIYRAVEYAFQAAKTFNRDEKLAIRDAPTPKEAKRFGNLVTLRSDWETVKVVYMERFIVLKFKLHPRLRAMLNTIEGEIIEHNYWHDNFWGDCLCPECKNIVGRNVVGKILMSIRDVRSLTYYLSAA
ncbi:MAG: NADAR family protein [Alphaproteobacteria bacterium]|nr:NADAR family protein [Alphaproteobacteria bacterium]